MRKIALQEIEMRPPGRNWRVIHVPVDLPVDLLVNQWGARYQLHE
jgi:hypothetical protein